MNNSDVSLEDLGWSPAHFALPQLDVNQCLSRVTVEHRGGYELAGPEGVFEAVLDGLLRESATNPTDYPAVGDWVIHSMDPVDHHRRGIQAVLPRKSRILRKAPGAAPIPQVVAANVDVLGVVISADQSLDLQIVERYLVIAEGGGACPVVIVNKSDLGGAASTRDQLMQRGISCPIAVISAKNGEGLSEISRLFGAGDTLAVTGPSGVGKSTLVNRLLGEESLATGSVTQDGSGRHTTIRRELLVVDHGVVIDTPGLREVQIWDSMGLENVFYEISAASRNCKFADCTHRGEPGCSVLSEVDGGQIDINRLSSYLSLWEEISILEREIDEYQRSQRRRRDGKRT